MNDDPVQEKREMSEGAAALLIATSVVAATLAYVLISVLA